MQWQFACRDHMCCQTHVSFAALLSIVSCSPLSSLLVNMSQVVQPLEVQVEGMPHIAIDPSAAAAHSAAGETQPIPVAFDAAPASGAPSEAAEEITQLRALVQQQAVQQAQMAATIQTLQAERQQQAAAAAPVPAASGPSSLAPAVARSAPPQSKSVYNYPPVRAKQQMHRVQYQHPGDTRCQIRTCRRAATQRCGYTSCCATCELRICVEHSGWANVGRSRVAACPEHRSNSECVIL